MNVPDPYQPDKEYTSPTTSPVLSPVTSPIKNDVRFTNQSFRRDSSGTELQLLLKHVRDLSTHPAPPINIDTSRILSSSLTEDIYNNGHQLPSLIPELPTLRPIPSNSNTSNTTTMTNANTTTCEAEGQEDDSLTDDNDNENYYDTINIYDESGKKKTLQKRTLSRHQAAKRAAIDNNSLKGERCKTYYKDSVKRANSRQSHLTGFFKKMRDLKVTTGDDTLLLHYKDYGAAKVTLKKYSTQLNLVKKGEDNDANRAGPSSAPAPNVLKAISPSKKRKATDKWVCHTCGITGGSKQDQEFDSDWIGCSFQAGDYTCNVWEHHKCVGLVMPNNLKSVHWICQKHRERPPKVKSVAKKGRR